MRSKLFVPASSAELFEKALRSSADAICFDLEDAVAASDKARARGHLDHFLSIPEFSGAKQLLVRVNPIGSADFWQDLTAVIKPGLFALALPKVEAPEDVEQAVQSISHLESERGVRDPIKILVTIETPRGLRRAHEIAAASSRVCGLQLGFADLLEPLGISSEDSETRQQIRLMLRLAAAEAGVDCYEAAYPHFRDEAGFIAQLSAARALGYAGASCIHPQQVEIANRIFTHTQQEIAYAESVIAAAKDAESHGHAVVELNGKMIDRPFVLRAEAILSRASRSAANNP